MNQALLLCAAVIYALVFWAVCVRRPHVALMLIVAASPFQNDLSGGGPVKFSLAEVNLLLSVPLALLGRRRLRLGPTFLPAMLYVGIGLACSLVHWRPTTLTSLVQMGIYLVVVIAVFATLARNAEDFRAALNALLVVCVFLSLVVCALRQAYIFGMHKNGIGASLATALVVAFALWSSERERAARWRYFIALAILAMGTVITLSRGAWVAAAAGVLIIMALRREFGLLFRTGIALGAAVTLAWLVLPASSREYATGFGAERWNIKMRYQSVDFALSKFRSSPVIGVGVGLRKEYDATNLALLTLAETGVPGLVAFALVQGTVIVCVWRTHQRVPRQGIAFAVVALAGALTIGKLLHGMVDHYWSRGSLTVTWAAVGMAAHVAQASRVPKRRRKPASLNPEPGSAEPAMLEHSLPVTVSQSCV